MSGANHIYTILQTVNEWNMGKKQSAIFSCEFLLLCRHWKSKPLQPEDYDGEWTDTEERTRIAVECHGKPK